MQMDITRPGQGVIGLTVHDEECVVVVAVAVQDLGQLDPLGGAHAAAVQVEGDL